MWDKVFKDGLSKICGKQSLKNLEGYDLLQALVPILLMKNHGFFLLETPSKFPKCIIPLKLLELTS